MIDQKIARNSFVHAVGAVAYIALVALFMTGIEKFLGQKEDMVLMPIGFLLLLVTSAAVMGMLVFGKPVMLYLDGQKREGATMAVYTIACLAAFTVLFFALMLFFL